MVAIPILVFLLSTVSSASAGTEQMMAMPILKETRSYAVPSTQAGEDLLDQRGFGDKEPEVRMMNLMMVEGSGYEGMDMGAMKMAGMAKSSEGEKKETPSEFNVELTKSPTPVKKGVNVFEFAIKDGKGNALKNLKLQAQVYMTSMDMGTESPRVREIKPGLYQIKASFSMNGPWAIKIVAPSGTKLLSISVEK